jgi:hypothetical protein
MLSDGQQYVATAWWLVTFPGLALFGLVLAVNLLGDTVRDRLDPTRSVPKRPFGGFRGRKGRQPGWLRPGRTGTPNNAKDQQGAAGGEGHGGGVPPSGRAGRPAGHGTSQDGQEA